MKNSDIKWNYNNNAQQSFLQIINRTHSGLPSYIQYIHNTSPLNEQLFIEFLAATGLRLGEAMKAFNKLVESGTNGYYNQELSCLEHYRHTEFLRGTKNAYLSFVNPEMIEKIMKSKPVSASKIQQHIQRMGLKIRLKELRSFNNTFLRQKGHIDSEVVDLLAGRIPKSVFVRHYYGIDLQQLSKQILVIQSQLVKDLYQ
jgi:intergrase/recombinase